MYRLLIIDKFGILNGVLARLDCGGLGVLPRQAVDFESAPEETDPPPDIVLAVIAPSGQDDIELPGKLRQALPDARIIIAGRRKSFELLRECLKHRVSHFLPAPVEPEELASALTEVIAGLKQDREADNWLHRYNKMVDTQLKDLFFQNCLMSNRYPDRLQIKAFLGIEDSHVSIGLVEPDYDRIFHHAFALKRIVEEEMAAHPVIGRKKLHMTTIIERSVLFATGPAPQEALDELIGRVRERFAAHAEVSLSASVIEDMPFDEINIAYTKLRQSIEYRFYLGGGSTLNPGDILTTKGGSLENYTNYYDRIAMAAYSGNLELVAGRIESCFELWKQRKHSASLLKFLCLELISHIIRHTGYEKTPPQSFVHIIADSRDSPDRMFSFTRDAIMEVTGENYHSNQSRNSGIVQQVAEYIRRNYQNENLTLYWISKNVVFMNEDYVGKLFKKEMGVNFSPYLINYRIERAKELLRHNPDIRVSDVAQQVGFNKNPQYFAYLFKKNTGQTPSRYKQSYRLEPGGEEES